VCSSVVVVVVVARAKETGTGTERDRREHSMRVLGRTATCMRVKSLSMGSSSRRGNTNLACSRRQRTVMKADVIATQYANALVNTAVGKNVLDDVRADMDSVAQLLKSDEKLNTFLTNPVAQQEKKKSLINAIAKEAEFNEFSTNFLCLLVDKQRITSVSEICDEFETIYCDVTDTEVATVTSAAALDNDQQFEIAKKLQSLTGAKNIKLKPKVDASLISGIIIQYGKGGSKLLDMSVRGQLDTIEAGLLANAPSA
jgi:F-type H+-transporting ATPase subunit delta